jgi:hypothetical protein
VCGRYDRDNTTAPGLVSTWHCFLSKQLLIVVGGLTVMQHNWTVQQHVIAGWQLHKDSTAAPTLLGNTTTTQHAAAVKKLQESCCYNAVKSSCLRYYRS